MKLYAGNTYWDKTVQSPYAFEKMTAPTTTDILIIGGGLSGNLCAYVLSSLGMDVTLVEKDKMGMGSSAANTGLLQYCSDRMLCEFADQIGEEKAVRIYQMCLAAMDQLTAMDQLLHNTSEYRLRDSIRYASSEKDSQKLKREYTYLKKYGFPAAFLSEKELKNQYQISKACAIRTWHDADINPLKLIQALLQKNLQQGVHYYEKTEIDLANIREKNAFTKDGWPIAYQHLVLTTGYARSYPLITKGSSINRTYAFCSSPISDFLWRDEVMVWETRIPYLYFRTTTDHRIIAGGLDELKVDLELDEGKIFAKAGEIAAQIKSILPQLHIPIDYAWNALFGKSNDGLPFIGRDPDKSNVYYCLGYEGNGTCYSMAGALIIKDLIMGRINPYQEIVKMDRI